MIGLVSRTIAVAFGACALVFLCAVYVGRMIAIPSRDGTTEILSAVLLVLAALDWMPVVLAGRLVMRAPDVRGLQDQFARLLFEALTATGLGILGLNYILGSLLPRGAGYFVLVLVALIASAASMHWLFITFRRR